MTRVILATSNPGKVREIEALLAGCGYEIVPQSNFGIGEAEETAPTFVENALLKARHASRLAGALPAIADDSGIEVDALNGAPGIRSARYAGERATDHANIARLLNALTGIDPPLRTARFRCVIVLIRHPEDPSPVIAEGTWEGAIALDPRGRNGFGYDPLFLPAGRACTAAELTKAQKNRISHRARALRRLATRIRHGI